MSNTTKKRDGFTIRDIDTNEEVEFLPCAKDGRGRERAEDGLFLKVDFERFYVEDTRNADE